MTIFQDYIDDTMKLWLQENNFHYKVASTKIDKGALNLLFTDNFCIKVYDRLGHGFGITLNVASKYDESIYDNDKFSLTLAFKYFNIKETASFSSRTESQYVQNLPNIIADIKNIIPQLNSLSSAEWDIMIEWINKETEKSFSNH